MFFSGCVAAGKGAGSGTNGVVSLPRAREGIIRYHESGQYYKDVSAKTKEVLAAVEKARKDGVKYPAVVMVVEDVLLSTYPERSSQAFSANEAAVKDLESHVILSALPAVKPSLALFGQLLDRNIPVFFVSFRAEDLRIPIMENLVKAGFAGWKGFYMLPGNYPQNMNFCEEVRKGLEKTGFHIIATVGVLEEDVSGKSAGLKVLYPNHIYSER